MTSRDNLYRRWKTSKSVPKHLNISGGGRFGDSISPFLVSWKSRTPTFDRKQLKDILYVHVASVSILLQRMSQKSSFVNFLIPLRDYIYTVCVFINICTWFILLFFLEEQLISLNFRLFVISRCGYYKPQIIFKIELFPLNYCWNLLL